MDYQSPKLHMSDSQRFAQFCHEESKHRELRPRQILFAIQDAYRDMGFTGNEAVKLKMSLLELASTGNTEKVIYQAICDACELHAASLQSVSSLALKK